MNPEPVKKPYSDGVDANLLHNTADHVNRKTGLITNKSVKSSQ